jgi:putative FmdB family regulatory protein
MPTYEFRCPEGHEFEKFYRKISDAVSELPCPVCGKPAMRLVSGGAGLLFKGSGFYLTDYGKNAHRKSGPSGGGESKSSSSSESSKSTESGGSDAKGSDAKPAESTPSAAKSDAAEKPKKPSSGTPKSES